MKEPMKIARRLRRQRFVLLRRIERAMETPLLLLSFVWLGLLVADFTGHSSRKLEMLSTCIWVVFGLDFVVRLWLAPDKIEYSKRNWLSILALLVPALRVFRVARVLRILRFARVTRGLRLFRLLTSLNRGMKALGKTLGRRGFGYVVALTTLVTLAGAAGIYVFENEAETAGFRNYGEALWWAAMLMTTLGSEAWPQTGEGRLLCFALSLYAFAVFGYVTATLATFFVGRDAENHGGEIAGAQEIRELRDEIQQLREVLQSITIERR